MNFLSFLFGSRREAKIEQLAETLAAQSALGTIGRLTSQIHSMGLHEARGYIRARASLIVYREISAARRDNELATIMAASDDFGELVMDATVRRVQQELHRRRLTAPPVRRAA